MNPHVRTGCASEALHRRLHSHEVQRRVTFLGEHKMLTCTQALLRLQASGLSEYQALSAIRAQRDLFYIQFIDVAYFPRFQWRYLWLRESIRESLEIFGDSKSKWQIALWFVQENPWLDGLRPIDLLDTNTRHVICAAEWAAKDLSASH